LQIGSRPRPMISFELIAKVERDTTARRTANLANLIKANEARKIRVLAYQAGFTTFIFYAPEVRCQYASHQVRSVQTPRSASPRSG
jgi:hypothetical protein